MIVKSMRNANSISKRAEPRRGKGGQDRDRMNVALVEDAQDDVDHEQRRGDEERLACQRGLERLCVALEASDDGRGQTDVVPRGLDRVHRLARARLRAPD